MLKKDEIRLVYETEKYEEKGKITFQNKLCADYGGTVWKSTNVAKFTLTDKEPHCGNYVILQARFCRKISVKTTLILKNLLYIAIDLTKKILRGSEFHVFPRYYCETFTLLITEKIFRQITNHDFFSSKIVIYFHEIFAKMCERKFP